jgi:hypothetical protein
MRAAVLSSLDTPQDDGSAAAKVFANVADVPRAPLADLARIIAAQGNTSAIATVVQSFSKSSDQAFSIAAALADGLKRSQRTLADVIPASILQNLVSQAGKISADSQQSLAARKEAATFLANGNSPQPLFALLGSRAPAELQISALSPSSETKMFPLLSCRFGRSCSQRLAPKSLRL